MASGRKTDWWTTTPTRWAKMQTEEKVERLRCVRMRGEGGVWSDESPHEPVTALLMDRQRDLWVAPDLVALVRRRGERSDAMPIENGLLKARALAEDEGASLWVGTEDGTVFRRTGDQFNPVPPLGAKPFEMIRFIVSDGRDTVWIGALNGGLYRWRAHERAIRQTVAPLSLRTINIMSNQD